MAPPAWRIDRQHSHARAHHGKWGTTLALARRCLCLTCSQDSSLVCSDSFGLRMTHHTSRTRLKGL